MVYCLVSDYLHILRKSHPLRRGGFAPDLSDEVVITPARPHDINFTEELVGGFSKTALGDKGFLDQWHAELLADRYGTQPIVPKRKNMKEPLSPLDKTKARLASQICKVIKTVGSHLTERFNLNKIRVNDLWHFQNRLVRKILAHTVAVFLNL